jgi:hypothetical protein
MYLTQYPCMLWVYRCGKGKGCRDAVYIGRTLPGYMTTQPITRQIFNSDHLVGEDRANCTTSYTDPLPQKLDSDSRHSGGKKSKLLFVLSNAGSSAVIRECCSLWRDPLCFVLAPSALSIPHLLFPKE